MANPARGASTNLAAAQVKKAKARVAERTNARARQIARLRKPGGIGLADEPDRVAARLDRLSRYWARAPRPATAAEVPRGATGEVLATAFERGHAWGRPPKASLASAGVVLERVIGTPDFVGINYLETGIVASRAVGRVNVRDGAGHVTGYGTGSLIAPQVLLTNHHVLRDAEETAASAIEFDFEDGPDGQPRQSRLFGFSPERLFVTDEELDFSLVAVDGEPGALAQYGYNPLIEAEGKVIVGEFVTIVQHPKGERKQVALRENRVVDVVAHLLHYEADTEPGSSGSPVFNDQWEMVALHHASVKAPPQDKSDGFVNEGIRISRIVDRLRKQSLRGDGAALLDKVVQPGGDRPVGVQVPAPSGPPGLPGREKIEIDPDYAHRRGYEAEFLGGGQRSVPLPELSKKLAAKAAVRTDADRGDADRHVLRYHHFSVVMNKERRLAFLTAVNIDGALSLRLKRESDRWAFDPRIPATDQTGEPVYADSRLDRGHLVRRLDPSWGDSAAGAKLANDDTFHFTNCAPQYDDFNRHTTLWAGIEDYILDHADNEDFKVSVFSGPVFGDDDEEFRGVKLPKQFWKVVAMAKSPGLLSATAYLLSQADLLEKGLEEMLAAEEEFAFGAYRTFQVPLSEIEALTGLCFGALPGFDPLATDEAVRLEPRHLVHESQAIL
jgi:endonuclease G, mitochondrial